MPLLVIMLTLAAMSTAAVADTVTVTRMRSDAYNEYAVACDGIEWKITDAGNPRTHGNGEIRLRSVTIEGETIVGYGGVGYLLSANDGTGGGWIAGGHGNTGTAFAVNTEPALITGQTTVAPLFRVTFAVLGYGASDTPIVILHYDLSLTCAGLTERIVVVALRQFAIQAEYVAVLTGAGECLAQRGIAEIQGLSEIGNPAQPVGCVNGTVYASASPGSVLWSRGAGINMSITTDVGPLPILIRARNSAVKAYLQRFGRADAEPLDTWSVANHYTIERIPVMAMD